MPTRKGRSSTWVPLTGVTSTTFFDGTFPPRVGGRRCPENHDEDVEVGHVGVGVCEVRGGVCGAWGGVCGLAVEGE